MVEGKRKKKDRERGGKNSRHKFFLVFGLISMKRD